MQQQSSSVDQFLIKLFDSLIHSKTSNHKEESSFQKINGIQDESFFSHFRNQLQMCKTNIRNLCQKPKNIEEPIARKLINTLLYLNKDIWTLLEDGVLNMYMDLVETKEKFSTSKDSQGIKGFVQSSIVQVQPLLYQFFAFKEYKKLQPGQAEKQRKAARTLSLVKKMSLSSNSQKHKDQQKFHSSTQLYTMDEAQINFVRQSIKKFKITQLLQNYLNDYEMQINQLEQVCKICSKNIKINHLEQHVEYCQKKYIFKQDINSIQNKIINHAQSLIEMEKSQLFNSLDNFQIQLQQPTNLNTFQNDEFTDLLYDLINTHKVGSYKNQTFKKIESQSLIKENVYKFQDLLHKMESFKQQMDPKISNNHHINHFIFMEKQIIRFVNDLRVLQLQHQNLKEIVSSSTIRPPSRSSIAKMSEKKSRFACNKNLSKSSKNSRNGEVDLQDQEFIRLENFDIDSQLEIDTDQDQQNNKNTKLMTKKSLNEQKNVHFNAKQYQDNNKQQQTDTKNESRSRRCRKIKSMIMFDSDSQQEKQQQHEKIQQTQSEDTSKMSETMSLNNFDILKFLGKGAFGKVYAVRKKNTTDLYALKMIDIDEDWGHQEFQQITNEHEIFKKVAGQHLVQAPYCFSQGSIHAFMMQFMPGGDLGKILEEQVYLEQDRARYVLAQIVLAIEHLHNSDIIHRDLKPQNLVIDEKGHLKLTDFGLSEIKMQNIITTIKNQTQNKQKKRLRRTGIVAKKEKVKLIGTPDYIAPQIINGISIKNKSIDWWSLGVMAYQILIGARPFCGNTIEQVIENILKLEIQWPEIGQQEGMITQNAHDFIRKLLDKDFVNRLGAKNVQQIKQHPFFEGIDWQSLKHQPASIMPNYAKIRELLEMQEDQELRRQISAKTSKQLKNFKAPQLENFIRFDILGQKTVKDAHKLKSKKTGTLKRLQSIKGIIGDKENQPTFDSQWGNFVI